MSSAAPCFIVDAHHKVMRAWAQHRSNSDSAPRLITLDHHTDTSPPFRKFIKQNHSSSDFDQIRSELLIAVDYRSEQTITEAVSRLNNDEHIVTALKTGIISSAFVIAHNAANTDVQVFKEHKIACKTAETHDDVLESDFLDQKIRGFNLLLDKMNEPSLLSLPYILDLDLDYLNTFKSVTPKNSTTFKKLIEGAELITIATEPDYVKRCALDEGLTSEFLLSGIEEFF